MPTFRAVTAWSPPIGLALFIFWESSRQWTAPVGPAGVDTGVLAHFVLFGALGLLFHRALVRSGMSNGRAAVVAAIVAIAYGVSDEVHQRFTPGRTPSAVDALVDAIGAVVAIGLNRRRIASATPMRTGDRPRRG